MALLEGTQLPFRTVKDRQKLVGRRISYLRSCDIDRSGRGYIFPQFGAVDHVEGRTIWLDNGEPVDKTDFREIVDLGPDKP